MKIGIDIRTAGGEKAGKGCYTFNIVQNLLKLDKENEYILYSNTKFTGFEDFSNATHKVINKKGLFWHLEVIRDIKREKVDTFFAPTSYIIPAFIPKKIKSILTVHDLVAFLFPDTHNKKAVFIEKLLLKRALKKANYVLPVSKNTKNDLLKKFKLEESKIRVLYCSADTSFRPIERGTLDEFIKKTQLPNNFILAVGTISPRKNYINLIKAFAIFTNTHSDYHLIIVGKKGWQYEDVFKEINGKGIKGRVHFLDYLSQKSLINLYSLAKAFVFPSFYEGFGIPPLEAMKCDCPVIASNRSSIPEVVGEAAIKIDPENPEEIAAAMKKIVEDPELRKSLIEKGRTRAEEFSWEKSAKELHELLS